MTTRHEDAQPNYPLGRLPSKSKPQRLMEKAKAKTKKVLNIESTEDDEVEETPDEAALREINESPAFNSSHFLNKARIGPSGVPDKAITILQGTVGAIVHPKSAIKRAATKKTAAKLAKSNPYLSRKADLEFLQAHDDLIRAEGSRSGSDDEAAAARKADNIDECEETISEMERRRKNMRVAWVTGRHVQRVRAVDAVPPPFPNESFFYEQDDCGYPEFKCGRWIAYKLLQATHSFTAQYIDDFEELLFDFDTLRRHIERLIIVSAPLQTFISDIRRVYRWEDPARTARWMTTYFFLWYISHIVTFFYAYICYSVLRNYYYPESFEALREGIERSLDRGATALKVGELMDKHGSDDWLEPLLEELGPYIQVQVADFANFLEATYSFYHFHSPAATKASFCLFAALFLLNAFTDSKFILKVFWLVVGMTIFIGWPISSLYPKYRLLVSPFKWSLWDVPTHAEWCIQYLQERAALAKEAIIAHATDDNHYVRTGAHTPPHIFLNDDIESDSDISFHSAKTDPTDEIEIDILSFGCTYSHVPGRFIISTHGIRFTSGVGRVLPYESFHKPFSELVEMSKRQTKSSILSPLAKVTTGMDKLELRFRGREGGMDADVVVLENMRGRDKAFNAMLGFSGVRWQHLQKRPEKRGASEKSAM